MNHTTLPAALAASTLLTCMMARADEQPMNDCGQIHESVYYLSPSELVPLCHTAMRTLGIVGAPKFSDFKHLATYIQAMSKMGYKRGQYDQIISEVAEIIKLRGQDKKPDQWDATANIVFKMYNVFNGAVTPTDFIGVLTGSGPLAETTSDDGLMRVMITFKHDRDNEWENK
jgi:hypothetical protein